MRKRTKRLAITLLLSVALLSMNMNYVYAEEMSLSDANLLPENQEAGADVSLDNGSTGNSGDVQPDSSEAAQPENGDTVGTENSGGTEADSTVSDGGETKPETDESKTDSVTGEGDVSGTETEPENPAQEDNKGTDDKTGDITGDNTETDGGVTVPDDAAAADTTEGEEPEKVYINQDGEEIVPSTLVGVDYNTIADNYDGATDVLKQYVVSDTDAANTIINSYVDENGNLVIVISQGAAKTDEEAEKSESGILSTITSALGLESETGGSGSAPAVDGSFTGWDDIPASYEFNWNKPDAWVDDVHYTETNSTDVRHEMKLYSDGENVYLKVVFAREFHNGQMGNGNDYQFWIDNQQMAAYQVEWPDGSSLSYNTAEPGVYKVDVRHRDSSWSYVLTDGAVAYYRINEDNLNNELELKIPLSEFVKQNGNIDLDNYSMISFFTPNLMQDKIHTGGASSGAEPFAAVVFLLIPASYVWLKRKDDKEDMAFA